VLGVGGSAIGYATLKGRTDQLQATLTTDLQAGQRELEAGKTSLTQASTKHDASLVAQAVAHFVAAKGQFLAAGQLADNSRLLRDLEALPGVGSLAQSRHTAVDGIAGTGAAISDAGQDLSDLYAQLITPTASSQPSRNVLTVLDQVQPSVVKIRGDLQRAQKDASQVDAAVIPAGQQATFLKARDTITSALAGLDEFDRLVPVLTDVLGGNGSRTYLVEQVNPSELRAGGGFIGTYSLLQADHGSLKVLQSGDAYDLADPRPKPGQAGFIPQPGPYREIIPDTSWSFVDTNEFPDFASNAKAAESFVQPRIGKIDGVISIDYFTVAKVIELTGPLAVPGYGAAFDSGSFVARVMGLELAGDPAHKSVLTAMAGPLMSRITSLSPEQWPALITALSGLAVDRNLQAYFNDARNEDEIDRVGWSGRVNAAGVADFMMEVESNYGGGKANYFLQRHYTMVLTRNGNVLHHKVTIDYTNNMPFYTRDFVNYRATLRLYVRPDATFTSNNLQAVQYAYSSPPAGTVALTGWLPIVNCCGGQAQAVLEYDTPWPVSVKGTHEIYWQKQPGTVNDTIDVIWSDGSGHTYRTSGALSQDQVITLTGMGVTLTPGHPALATLPSLSLG
jgi:hypothetical protein